MSDMRNLSEIDRLNLRAVWSELASKQDLLVTRLYELFFARCPEAKQLFKSSMKDQKLALKTMIDFLIAEANLPAVMNYEYKKLQRSHEKAGVTKSQSEAFTDCLVEVIQELLGESFTDFREVSWRKAFDLEIKG